VARPESLVKTQIDPSQRENKNSCYHSSKIQFGDRLRARLSSRKGLTFDPSQDKDKNDYYHNFKI